MLHIIADSSVEVTQWDLESMYAAAAAFPARVAACPQRTWYGARQPV